MSGPTDEQIMASLTEIPHERLGAQVLRTVAELELAGAHLTAFEVAGIAAPTELAPVIMITHAAPRPSMTAIRTAYENMRARHAGRRP